jgi:SAM-dependent methyltransferase
MSAEGIYHLGLMADLNDATNRDDAPEIDFYAGVVARGGGPALDAGCGPGRLLRRCLAAGIEIEGSDVSADILDICRRRCAEAGFEPALHHQATGALDLPHRFRTVVMCGSFGLNGVRADDMESLRRVHRHLLEGGTLTFDLEPGWVDPDLWQLFADPSGLPSAWRMTRSVERGDGSVIRYQSRTLEVDRLEMSVTRETQCELIRDGDVIQTEVHPLVERFYNPHEVLQMLREAGFDEASVIEQPLWGGEPFHVFTAVRR